MKARRGSCEGSDNHQPFGGDEKSVVHGCPGPKGRRRIAAAEDKETNRGELRQDRIHRDGYIIDHLGVGAAERNHDRPDALNHASRSRGRDCEDGRGQLRERKDHRWPSRSKPAAPSASIEREIRKQKSIRPQLAARRVRSTNLHEGGSGRFRLRELRRSEAVEVGERPPRHKPQSP